MLQCVAVHHRHLDVVALMLLLPGVLQLVAACCILLQCVAVWCNLLQCVCSVLQCVCSVLQCVAEWCSVLHLVAVCCSVSQHIAVCHSVLQCLQCVTVCCGMLQCVTVCYSVLDICWDHRYLDVVALLLLPVVLQRVAAECSALHCIAISHTYCPKRGKKKCHTHTLLCESESERQSRVSGIHRVSKRERVYVGSHFICHTLTLLCACVCVLVFLRLVVCWMRVCVCVCG